MQVPKKNKVLGAKMILVSTNQQKLYIYIKKCPSTRHSNSKHHL